MSSFQWTRLILAAFTLAWGLDVRAQTIGDYSRSQRAVIEADIAKNNAKVLGAASPQPALAPPLPVSLPPLPAGPIPTPIPAIEPLRSADDPLRAGKRSSSIPGEPPWVVSGAFVSATKVVAEVIVDGNPYWLRVGDEVPGTRWRVESIAVNKVVLAGISGKGNRSTTMHRAITLAGGDFR